MCLVTYSWAKTDSIEKVKKYQRKNNPTWGVIEVTEACNFNCKWCYVMDSDIRNKPRYMGKEVLFRIVDILANSGIKQITYSGGETLMYPYLYEAVEYASQKGLIVHVNSNGYFLTEEMAKKLSKLGLTQIEMNIESLSPEEHDYVRGKGGSFKRVVRAFEYALDNGITCVAMSVMTTRNVNEIPDIIKFIRSKGIQRYRVGDVVQSGDGIKCKNLRGENYLNTLKKISDFAVDLEAQHILSYEPLFPLDYKKSIKVSHVPCPFGKKLVVNVLVDGKVCYCAGLRDKILYNILDHEDITELHKIEVDKFNRTFNTPPGCSSCEHFEKCEAGCHVRRRFETEQKDPRCERLLLASA